jgi:hypothetical protein
MFKSVIVRLEIVLWPGVMLVRGLCGIRRGSGFLPFSTIVKVAFIFWLKCSMIPPLMAIVLNIVMVHAKR